jgi:hypothetical protein
MDINMASNALVDMISKTVSDEPTTYGERVVGDTVLRVRSIMTDSLHHTHINGEFSFGSGHWIRYLILIPRIASPFIDQRTIIEFGMIDATDDENDIVVETAATMTSPNHLVRMYRGHPSV